MDSLDDANTLKLILDDGQTVLLPKWFSNQFEYFKNILEDIGETLEDINGNDYKYLELDLKGTELGELLDVNVLLFLKKYAYYMECMTDGRRDDDEGWHKSDNFQRQKIDKYLNDQKFNDLFKLYVAVNYLMNTELSQTITDCVLSYMDKKNILNIGDIMKTFNIESEYSSDQQKNILNAFAWND